MANNPANNPQKDNLTNPKQSGLKPNQDTGKSASQSNSDQSRSTQSGQNWQQTKQSGSSGSSSSSSDKNRSQNEDE